MSTRKLRAEIEHFHSYLRQNGLKKTYQKDLILETFLNTEGHLSVEDIYALVKKRDRKVGVVTVFRALKSFAACGIAREITLGDGLTRFEHSYHHPPHHHIVCMECHKAIEFVCPALEKIQDDIIKKYHFEPSFHRFLTYGICEDCRNRLPAGKTQKQDTERIFARDAIKMALCMENRCLDFYRGSAKRNQDSDGREFLEQMILEEEKHIAELKARLEELVKHEEGLDNAPVFLHFDACDLDALVPEIDSYDRSGELRLNARASMDLALSFNRRTVDFFKAFAEKFAETQGKQILLDFVRQEGCHGEFIQKRMQAMQSASGPG